MKIINDTLNEIFQKILTGADYASKIAVETSKSIPVVFRQIEALAKTGIIYKQRVGKKVAYMINWSNLSEIVASLIFLDLTRFKNAFKDNKDVENIFKNTSLAKSEKELEKEAKRFFEDHRVQDLLKKFIHKLETTGKQFSEYSKLPFEKTIDLFLEIFGKMSLEKQKEFFGKDHSKFKKFLDICKLKYKKRELINPTNEFS